MTGTRRSRHCATLREQRTRLAASILALFAALGCDDECDGSDAACAGDDVLVEQTEPEPEDASVTEAAPAGAAVDGGRSDAGGAAMDVAGSDPRDAATVETADTGVDGAARGTRPDSGPRKDGADDAGLCCPISEQPDCCMQYGGSRGERGSCDEVCDGIPVPEEAWQRGVDENGCEYWIEPEPTRPYCASAPASCVAQRARSTGDDCSGDAFGYAFDGRECRAVECACEGPDCEELSRTLAACEERFASCRQLLECLPPAVSGAACDAGSGWIWDGAACVLSAICYDDRTRYDDESTCLEAYAQCDPRELVTSCSSDEDCVLVEDCCSGDGTGAIRAEFAELWNDKPEYWTRNGCPEECEREDTGQRAICFPGWATNSGYYVCEVQY